MATASDTQGKSGVISRVGSFVLGRRLASGQESSERLSNVTALAVLSSDALSSVAYATEELLLVLVLVVAGVMWSVPIALAIIALLVILTFSYRQTIRAYPEGGGAYNVAKENLGTRAGLVAASGLLIDYVLTAAVSITAGVAALTSAYPGLREIRVEIGLSALALLMLVNLRGVRSTGRIFTIPTLAFVASMLALLGGGIYTVWRGNTPAAPVVTPGEGAALGAVSVLLLLRAFSSGSTALTGIEAMANGTKMFKPPEAGNARVTLLWMGAILAVLFFGVTWFAQEFHIVPVDNETVISQIAGVVFGDGPFYYVIQFSTMMILLLAANTAFSGFPRVVSLLGRDRYLPHQFAGTGRRLVYSNGILLLAVLSGVLMVVFGGDVHRLIPIYAVGVFMSFTLSQAGMFRHWLRERGYGWQWSAVINGTGAVVTGVALIVIAVTKFAHGAWAVIVLVILILYLFYSIRRHYEKVARELSLEGYQPSAVPIRHTVVIPVSGVHRGVLNAVAYARSVSADVRAVYVCTNPAEAEALLRKWQTYVPDIPLTVINSPYRLVLRPFLLYLDEIRGADSPFITVVIPDFIPMHWWEWLLHSQTAWLFRLSLMFRRNLAVVSVHHQLSR